MLLQFFNCTSFSIFYAYCIFIIATRNKVLTEANIEKWCVICACALSTLEDVCMRVENGNIPITELRKIENRKGQMNKLCEAAVFEHGASVLPVDKFNEKFKQRIAEYNHFEHYRKVLKRLLEWLSAVNVQGERSISIITALHALDTIILYYFL